MKSVSGLYFCCFLVYGEFLFGILFFLVYNNGILSRRAVPTRARSFTLLDRVLLAWRAVKLSVEKSLLDEPPTEDLLKLSFVHSHVSDDFIEAKLLSLKLEVM